MAGGRPRNETPTRRDCVVSVRLSEAERADLAARASAAALPVADFSRFALVATAPRARAVRRSAAPTLSPAELDALNTVGVELRAIGNNVNQIARALNSGEGRAIEDDLRGELGALVQARARLDAIFARFLA